jgi:hypothetical protein
MGNARKTFLKIPKIEQNITLCLPRNQVCFAEPNIYISVGKILNVEIYIFKNSNFAV